ncbi:hypothetical protein DSO57_1024095 [Entomophthora muscae]|uniref:Uncharacterized protein n=1 Tax=Entomophthora muscae TaxID=34485 RepID=A0ACC2SFA0_9FUNG|nr:hypothetical protein DSO57_1024095 [Entomophthora muscae]
MGKGHILQQCLYAFHGRKHGFMGLEVNTQELVNLESLIASHVRFMCGQLAACDQLLSLQGLLWFKGNVHEGVLIHFKSVKNAGSTRQQGSNQVGLRPTIQLPGHLKPDQEVNLDYQINQHEQMMIPHGGYLNLALDSLAGSSHPLFHPAM